MSGSSGTGRSYREQVPVQVDPTDTEILQKLQAILSAQLHDGGPRFSIHPGDLAWWVWHADPRLAHQMSYWLDEDVGFVVLNAHEGEVDVFTVPGALPGPLVEWGLRQIGPGGRFMAVSNRDTGTEAELAELGLEPVGEFGPLLVRELTDIDDPALPSGWELRPVLGEHEADARRRASHAAFESAMEPGEHLERYLRFMRSPVYDAERDLVVVDPEGRVASFIVWWPDSSGIAQIEPFGTDPAFQRRGTGRALMLFALLRMRDAGMTSARVITDAYRADAIGFYTALGFEHVADLRNWGRPGE
jgi:ribosomal protein S18 acetylase RimI-like enzyme